MSIKKLFEQLSEIKDSVTIPKILMGYLNPVLQFGFENFCQKCADDYVREQTRNDVSWARRVAGM